MRAVLLALSLWLCLSLVSRTDAQSTATPSPFISGAQATILFPQAIRFSLVTDLPAGGIRSAQLVLTADNQTLTTIDVDITQAELEGKTPGTLDILWMIGTAPAPKLFETLYATWDVIAADGRQQTFITNIQFTDPRLDWVTATNDAGTLAIALPTKAGDPNSLLRGIQPVVRQIFGPNAPSFRWVVYPPTVAPGCTLDKNNRPVAVNQTDSIVCDPTHTAALYDAVGYRPLRAETGTAASAIAAISTDLVNERFGASWDAAHVPAWFRYGFTAFFTASRKTALLAPAVAAARAQQLNSLDQLASATTQNDLWRAESDALVLYLGGRMGLDGLMTLAEQIGPDTSFQTAVEAALGQPLTALVPTVQRWLLTNAAVDAFNYVPYGPATATPAPTASPSATSTTPPTATATLFPSRTPVPTTTPTRTPLTLTPSTTPRPANSLALWTPVSPSAPPVAQTPPETLAPLEIVLLAVAAAITIGLIALYIRLGKRK